MNLYALFALLGINPSWQATQTRLSSAVGGNKAKNFVRKAEAMGDCCIFGAGPGVVFLMAAIMVDLFGVLRQIGIPRALAKHGLVIWETR